MGSENWPKIERKPPANREEVEGRTRSLIAQLKTRANLAKKAGNRSLAEELNEEIKYWEKFLERIE